MTDKKQTDKDKPLAAGAKSNVDSLSSPLLAELFDRLSGAVVVADTNRRMVYVNAAAENLFGYDKDELYGRETKILYAIEEEFHEQGIKRFNPAIKSVAETYRLRYRRADGEVFLGQTIGATMRSKDEAVIGFIGIIQPARSAEESLNTLQRLHAITSDTSLDHAERIDAVLALGLDHFGLDIAIQSRIQGDQYLVEHCVDASGGLAPMMKFGLPGTYCVHTVKSVGAVGFHYVGNSEIKEHPCYLNFKLESYIGGRIKIGKSLYGTISFSGRTSTEPFSKDDNILVQLLADTLGYLIYKNSQDEMLWELATTDELTGLANRRSTLERLTQHVKLSHRSGMPLTVVSIDLDHFKSINDSWGHSGGDVALVAFSQRAKKIGRSVDFCGRMGGEEFVLVLPDTNSRGGVVAGEYLRELLASVPVKMEGGESITLTLSAGVASLEPGETLDGLLARADEAMYAVKQGGRDRVCVYQPQSGD